MTADERIAEDGPPTTAHQLAATLLAGPDIPVVVAVDGPDPDVASPVEWTGVMGYSPDSPQHGDVSNWDEADDDDDPDPDVVRAVVIGQRGMPDEAWAGWARSNRGGLALEKTP